MKLKLIFLLLVSFIVVAGCSTNKFTASKILPGRWESISKKGKSVVLTFKANQEVELIHGRLKLKSIKGKHKVVYAMDQSVVPNRIKLMIYQYNALMGKPKTLGLIFKILSPDTILIAINAKVGEYPKSFEAVPAKDKTVLVKTPEIP